MQIGFIGLGTMGGHMAANLVKAGHRIAVHDLRRAAADRLVRQGAAWKDSPRELGTSCDVVLTSLPGPKEVELVACGDDGLIHGMRPGSIYFDLSTNSPACVRAVHQAFAAKGIFALDTPVSGGPKGAESGKLAIWVGGDKGAFDKARAVLDDIGDQVRYIGPIGAATVAKLVHNCANYVITVALSEVFSLGIKAGVEPLALFDAVRNGAIGRRRTFDGLIDQYLPGSYDKPSFALALAHKDVALATGLGRELGVPMRLSSMTLEEMTEAVARGWSARDSRSVMLLQQERAGISVAVDPEEIQALLAAHAAN